MRRPPIAEPAMSGRGGPLRSLGMMGLLALLGAMVAASALAQDGGPSPAPTPPVSSDGGGGEPSEAEDDEERPPAPPRRVGPIVRSAHEAKSSSPFLRSTEVDSYGESIDWRSVPLWQQTSFFGIRARGSFFVYVVDCSGSMDDERRLDRAKQELRRSINSLRFPQRFLVIFFNHRSMPMIGGVPRSADAKNKRSALAWLNTIDADGGTDPRAAMKLALALRPDAVFLLSDGEFPRTSEATILDGNRDRIPIHCINLGSGAGAEQLRTIAEGSGGTYSFRE